MSLVMRIRSLFDGSGAKAAADAQKELAAKSKTASDATAAGSKNLQQAGQVASRAAEQIGSVATVMGATGGAAGQAAAGVRLLAGALQTISTVGKGIVGVLGAIVMVLSSVLVNWLLKTANKTKELNEQAEKTEGILTDMSKITMDAITSQFDKLRDSVSGAADQVERMIAAKNRMLTAQEQADLAQLDLEKAKALSKADRSDPFASKRIEAEYAAKAVDVTSSAEKARKTNDIALAESKLKELRDLAAAYDKEAAQKQGVVDNGKERYERMQQRKGFLDANPSVGTQKERDALFADMSKLAAAINENTKAVKDASEKGGKVREQIDAAQMDAITARANRSTVDYQTQTRVIEGSNTVNTINYEQNKVIQEQKEKQRQQAAEETLTRQQANRDVLQAQGNLRTARNSGAPSSEVAELKAKLDEAERSRDALLRTVETFAQRTVEAQNRTQEVISNL